MKGPGDFSPEEREVTEAEAEEAARVRDMAPRAARIFDEIQEYRRRRAGYVPADVAAPKGPVRS